MRRPTTEAMAMDAAADRRRRDAKFELVQRGFLLYDLLITSLIELNVHVLTDIVDDGRTVGRYVLTGTHRSLHTRGTVLLA